MNRTPKGYEYAVHVVNLPYTVLAAVAATDSDFYHVFLNDCLSPELRCRALEHELHHIDEGHLQNDVLTVTEMELAADGQPTGRLPNVFRENPPGSIPYFESLDAFRRYLLAMREQDQRDRSWG